MSRSAKCLFTLLALAVLACPPAVAGEPARPVRALLVAGGCCHDYKNQTGLLTRGLSRRANIQWTIAYDSDTTTRHKNPIYLEADWSKDFDVIVHDECSSDVNDMQVIETILKPHKKGLPAVVLHCGMHSYRTEGWNKHVATPWMQFTGLISTGHGPQQPIAVKFVDKNHAITKDLGDWTTINEELYNNASGKLEPTAHALASGTQVYTVFRQKDGKDDRTGPGEEVTARSVVAWTNTYNGKTNVFATTLGHNNATVNDPRYLDLVARGLLWSLGKLDAEHIKAVE
jgi:type 1 glutamine amidotransferase